MTHKEQADRREAIAANLPDRNWVTHEEVCQLACRHMVSESTVENVVRARGKRIKSGVPKMARSTYEVIAALLSGERQAGIVKRLGYTRQRVNQIHVAMVISGVYAAARKKLKEVCA